MARRNGNTLDVYGSDNSIEAQHATLKQNVADAEAKQHWWATMADSEEFHELQGEMEYTIHNAREGLETAKGDDIKTLQSDIRSRKELIRAIENRISMDAVNAARRALQAFESDNALLIEQAQ